MRDFYERILPAQGVYCVAGIDSNGRVLHLFAESLDELVSDVKELRSVGANIFVAPGSFLNHSRRADNAAFVRSFFIDLDVGDNKPHRTQDEALAALDQFVTAHNLPPPILVNSGGGVHAYWAFDEDVPAAVWKPYAKKFKDFCLEHGLHIDPAVTADAARIMRCPDTSNYKYDPPLPTSVIGQNLWTYSWESFKEFLGDIEPDTLDVLKTVHQGLDEDTKKFLKLNNFETTFSSIAERSLTGDGCAQIKHILLDAAALEEPLWYAGLSIARHCEDWETAIHLMSEDHPEYNHARTIKKAEQTVGKPQGCGVFDSLNPGVCHGCPHRGKITNPLALGRRLKQSDEPAPLSHAAFVAAEEATQDPFKAPSHGPKATQTPLPKALFPYQRGVNGGIYFRPMPVVSKDGKTTQEDDIRLTPHDFYPIKRMYSNTEGECLLMRAILPNDPCREFPLPMKDLYLPDRFKETISKRGVLFRNDAKVVQLLMNYVVRWGEFLIDSNCAEQMRMQMGFTEDGTSFVIGDTEIMSDGTEARTAASPFVRNIAKLLRPEGSYDLWKEAANALNEPGFEMQAFALMTGFGSPLMRLTSTSGVVVCFTGKSGGAKTGSLYAAASIFGNPKELSVFDATENGMIGRYLGLHNILLGCDEVTNNRADRLSNLIHRISHGKAKIRMQASVNAERELEMSASLIGFFTSNLSIYDKLTDLKASPDGEVARLIEFTIRNPHPLEINPRRGKQIFDVFRVNYGFAGPEFIKHYFKTGEGYSQSLITKWGNRFSKDFGEHTAYRFYENLIASTFAAAELANDAGIIHYDLDRIYTKVVTEMVSIRDNTIKVNHTDYKSLLSEFLDKNHNSVLILDGARVTSEPRGNSLVARSEIHTQTLYVSKTEFKKYLSGIQVSSKEFEIAMRGEGLLMDGVKKQRLSTGWKAGLQFAPVAVYAFKYEPTETDGKPK